MRFLAQPLPSAAEMIKLVHSFAEDWPNLANR
jgi:hypothetical protein